MVIRHAGPESALAAAWSVPRLHGARCVGEHDLFDHTADSTDRSRMYRSRQVAVSICLGCPALAACADWLERTPEHERPSGIVAARLIPIRGPRTDHQKLKQRKELA